MLETCPGAHHVQSNRGWKVGLDLFDPKHVITLPAAWCLPNTLMVAQLFPSCVTQTYPWCNKNAGISHHAMVCHSSDRSARKHQVTDSKLFSVCRWMCAVTIDFGLWLQAFWLPKDVCSATWLQKHIWCGSHSLKAMLGCGELNAQGFTEHCW